MLQAEPVFGKSNLIYTLIRADGVVVVPLDQGGLYAGEEVPVQLYMSATAFAYRKSLFMGIAEDMHTHTRQYYLSDIPLSEALKNSMML